LLNNVDITPPVHHCAFNDAALLHKNAIKLSKCVMLDAPASSRQTVPEHKNLEKEAGTKSGCKKLQPMKGNKTS